MWATIHFLFLLKIWKGFRIIYEDITNEDKEALVPHPYCTEEQMAVFIGYSTDQTDGYKGIIFDTHILSIIKTFEFELNLFNEGRFNDMMSG